MIKFKFEISAEKAYRKIEYVREQVPYATALSLTRTAQGARDDIKAAIPGIFQHVAPLTRNAIYIKSADKRRLAEGALVGVKEAAQGYLGPEIFGGQRGPGIEKILNAVGLPPAGTFAIPTPNAKFVGGGKGRVSLAWLSNICSQLGTGRTEGRKRKNQTQIFALIAKRGGLRPGIYSKKSGTVTPLILFVPHVRYSAKFDFFGIGKTSAYRRFPGEFARAVDVALRSMK
jgi:hypothetical protein